ncbi:eukaryotic aspartyl protease family protein [Striga asiatica]|uniref:Eukaryotic aspartyl protease family protein n=1 Tax=Striga asiatica TaxID=4170 RepID=A0A5A7RET2_STRAF|nr:eukaryotic aspartyl protease family protein [Striga asiatica]
MCWFKKSVVEVVLLLIVVGCWVNVDVCEAFGTFGFDIHHRYSDKVKEFLDVDGLPEKGSLGYYAAMAHRDQLFKARRLTTANSTSILTFYGGNQTFRIASLGFLHYAVVAVGTPPLAYLVALDTGSDLFCPSNSSSSNPVPCNSTICERRRRRGCSTSRNACSYQEIYLSNNTSTAGILVDDVLHLGTDSSQQNIVEAPITLGCGTTQTGDFLDGAAVNGLFGLGMDSISVPSILASRGLTANSFSMCFGSDGIGRINFGDKGSPDQRVTSFNLGQQNPTYNITVTQIAVENNVTDLEFTAVFDSGTSFTYLNNPAYSVIAESFSTRKLQHSELELDNERWKPIFCSCTNCCNSPPGYDSVSSNTLPVNNTNNSTIAPSPSALEPEATPANRSQSPVPSISRPAQPLPPPSPPATSLSGGGAARLNGLVKIVLSICLCSFIFLCL